MQRTVKLTAIIEKEGDGYVALCPQLDIASEGDTVDEARAMLIDALRGWFESASDEEVTRSLPTEILIEPLELSVG